METFGLAAFEKAEETRLDNETSTPSWPLLVVSTVIHNCHGEQVICFRQVGSVVATPNEQLWCLCSALRFQVKQS